MKTDHENENQNENQNEIALRTLLQEWRQEASPPPRFQEQVWQRIERAEAAPGPSVSLATVFAHWLANRLPRPALATAYVVVLLVVGAGLGWSQARQEAARVAGELGARYAQAVDPYRSKSQP